MKKCDNHSDHLVDTIKEGHWLIEVFVRKDEDGKYRKYESTLFLCNNCFGEELSDYPWQTMQESIGEA